jgi:branched-subunit amino acid ABC-type transport system permease component
MSLLETMLAGIGGSLVAGLIAYYLFDRNEGPGLLLSLLCTIGIVYAVRKYRQRTAPPPTATPLTFGQGNTQTRVYFFPGCLLFSLLASIVLTVLLNLIIRAF